MRALIIFALVSTSALAQTVVKADQGRPGNQGPWPVTLSGGGGGIVVIIDGGVQVAYRPEPQTLVYIPAPYSGEAAGNAGRVGAHVATGGVAEAGADAGHLAYLPIPLARHNTTNSDTQYQNTVVGVRIAGAQGNTDLVLPIFIDGTNQTPGHGVIIAGRNYQDDGSGDVDVRIQRLGVSGATVLDNHCFTPTNSVVAVSTDAGSYNVPAAALTDRRFAQICNDPRNTSSAYISCSETTVPVDSISSPTDTIFPGDCITYWVGSSIPIRCVSNAVNTYAQVKQCY